MPVKIKICGISDIASIDIINKMLPDFVGFVFAPSRRSVSIEKAKQIMLYLDKRISRVGIFADQPKEVIQKIISETKLNLLQFHGKETNDFISEFEIPAWKAIGINSSKDLEAMENYTADAFVLDSIKEGKTGGTGRVFDWRLCKNIGERHKVILAGGLNLKNVNEAIKIVKPYCVDVSSGVETEEKKDARKIEEFINKVRGN